MVCVLSSTQRRPLHDEKFLHFLKVVAGGHRKRQESSVGIGLRGIVELYELVAPAVAGLLEFLALRFAEDDNNRKAPVSRDEGAQGLRLLVAQGPAALPAPVEPLGCEDSGIVFIDPGLQLPPAIEGLRSDPFADGIGAGRQGCRQAVTGLGRGFHLFCLSSGNRAAGARCVSIAYAPPALASGSRSLTAERSSAASAASRADAAVCSSRKAVACTVRNW